MQKDIFSPSHQIFPTKQSDGVAKVGCSGSGRWNIFQPSSQSTALCQLCSAVHCSAIALILHMKSLHLLLVKNSEKRKKITTPGDPGKFVLSVQCSQGATLCGLFEAIPGSIISHPACNTAQCTVHTAQCTHIQFFYLH